MARPLTLAEREELGARAYELSLKGASNRAISRQLKVSDKTVSKLVRQEAIRRSEQRPDYLQRAIDAHQLIIRRIWTVLDSGRNVSDHALAQLAHAVTNAQSQLDRITGVLAPIKTDVRVTIASEGDYIRNLGDEALEAVSLLLEAGAAGQDGRDALEKIVELYQRGELAPKFTVSSRDLFEQVPKEDRERVENLNELLALESPEDTYDDSVDEEHYRPDP